MQKYSLNNHNVLLFFCEFKSVLNSRYFLPYAGSPPGPAESTTRSTGPGRWLPCGPSQDASGMWAACRSRPFLWLCFSSEHTAPLTCFFSAQQEGGVRQLMSHPTSVPRLSQSSHGNRHSRLQAVVETHTVKYRKLSYGYCGVLTLEHESLLQGCLA